MVEHQRILPTEKTTRVEGFSIAIGPEGKGLSVIARGVFEGQVFGEKIVAQYHDADSLVRAAHAGIRFAHVEGVGQNGPGCVVADELDERLVLGDDNLTPVYAGFHTDDIGLGRVRRSCGDGRLDRGERSGTIGCDDHSVRV